MRWQSRVQIVVAMTMGDVEVHVTDHSVLGICTCFACSAVNRHI